MKIKNKKIDQFIKTDLDVIEIVEPSLHYHQLHKKILQQKVSHHRNFVNESSLNCLLPINSNEFLITQNKNIKYYNVTSQYQTRSDFMKNDIFGITISNGYLLMGDKKGCLNISYLTN